MKHNVGSAAAGCTKPAPHGSPPSPAPLLELKVNSAVDRSTRFPLPLDRSGATSVDADGFLPIFTSVRRRSLAQPCSCADTQSHECNFDRRVKSARYITAAVIAVFVVSTLYYIQIPAGHPTGRFSSWNNSPRPWQHPISPSSPLWDTRAAQVKQAYIHAYQGYLKYAEGFDELRPLSNTGVNK